MKSYNNSEAMKVLVPAVQDARGEVESTDFMDDLLEEAICSIREKFLIKDEKEATKALEDTQGGQWFIIGFLQSFDIKRYTEERPQDYTDIYQYVKPMAVKDAATAGNLYLQYRAALYLIDAVAATFGKKAEITHSTPENIDKLIHTIENRDF